MALISGHLLRYSMITPIVKLTVLSVALRDLRFQEVMMMCGTFFLHELKNMKLRDLDVSEDPSILVKLFGHPFKPRKKSSPEALALIPQKRTNEYPWGERVPLSRLVDLLNSVPEQFIKKHVVPQMSHPDSAKIFMYFTKQIGWLLKEDRRGPELDPRNLADAMQLWSVSKLQDRFHGIYLSPTFGGLICTGRLPQTQFKDQMEFFFPSKEKLDGSSIKAFPSEHHASYISCYYQILDSHSQEHVIKLKSDLGKIFDSLQCLPACTRDGKITNIWTENEAGQLQFLTNSKLYRLKAVSENSRKRRERAQLHMRLASQKVFDML